MATVVRARPLVAQAQSTALNIIDTDVHERAEMHALLPYLAPEWRKYITDFGWQPERLLPFAQFATGGLDRQDAKLPDGRPGGSDLSLLRSQLLDEYDIDYAVLTGWLDASALHPGWSEFKTALMSAYNDWQLETWVEREPRLLGSVHVNAHDPVGAAREIDRIGSHPKMMQVVLYFGDKAFGDPYYHPIFEAAVRNNLPVGMHHSENSPTALGFHRYFIEWHTLVPQVFMSEMVSLIFNGVFDKYPELKVIMIEGGTTYVPHLMSRADQQYKELRSEVPWVKRMPSDIIREHFRFATQPTEEMSAKQFLAMIDAVGSEDLFCFSTDYPHWDFDSPVEALPAGLPESLQRKIFYQNAQNLYPKMPALKPR
ncbi:amidohydrolase [Pseudonocardia asaccharolytica DSM 44247 = NBRC 16224]|uniref:Amidohydrolase n=1 Tax=Pseudonocardia asaccharolytica DSM 44247 = NBRC 16224 TaxID=1123024 RepID=A0A511D8V1_9PSEU|nr:amidohydrolase [Pseudonocardia asaccharolytica DSM 44247 = NBRC 16224]